MPIGQEKPALEEIGKFLPQIFWLQFYGKEIWQEWELTQRKGQIKGLTL